MSKDEMIKKYLKIEFTFTDLFYAYCASKGIDDPEGDPDMTDELYSQLEKECEEKINYTMIVNLANEIMHDGMERINNLAWK